MLVHQRIEFCETLSSAVRDMHIHIEPGAIERMADHWALILAATKDFNLTAILDVRKAAFKHYADSLALLKILDRLGESGRAIDIGTGAGFPGIPLALARPQWHWTLVESIKKKSAFLQQSILALQMPNATCSTERSEDLARTLPFRDGYDLATGRAVAPLGALAELLLPFVRPGGVAVAMKSREETMPPTAATALVNLGARGEVKNIEYDLPQEMGQRRLIVMEKVEATAPEYPRRPGRATKRPLF